MKRLEKIFLNFVMSNEFLWQREGKKIVAREKKESEVERESRIGVVKERKKILFTINHHNFH